MSDREKIDQRLKNKIVSAILSYPPDTMSKAELMADQILAALEPAQAGDVDGLKAENKALRETLEPFARFADTFKDMYAGGARTWGELPDDTPFYGLNGNEVVITVGDLRRARAALTKGGEGDGAA